MSVPPAPTVPEAVRAFIAGSFESVEVCEVLLVLHAGARRSWSAREVSRALRLPVGIVQAHLETLARRSLLDVRLTSDLRYRFAPAQPGLEPVIASLSGLYHARPSVVAEIIADTSAR